MKIKVTFLLDPNNSWIKDQLLSYNFNLNKKYSFKIFNDYKKIKNQDIVFAISYTKILPEKFLNKNKIVLIPHCSKLPKDRGFSPIQNQIIIYICCFSINWKYSIIYVFYVFYYYIYTMSHIL